MKKVFLVVTLCLSVFSWAVTPTSPDQIPAYYSNLNQKQGKSLFDAIHVVSKVGYSSLGYKGLWTAYRETDLNEDGKIWDMYSNCDFTYSADQCGTYGKECDCYNREHSIPKSWFGGAESQPGCDIFHIVPTDGKVNGMRSNYAFGEVSSSTYSYDGAKLGSPKAIMIDSTLLGTSSRSVSTSSSRVFEPQDQYKGDFARGYLGTMVRWAGDYQAFTTGEGGEIFSGVYTLTGYFGLTDYGIALLLKWHREDPVSQKEIDRNNGIQQTQGNRNPFIDYPYLVEYIWGCHAGETLSLSQLLPSTDPAFVPGESNGWNSNTDPTDYLLLQETMDQQVVGSKYWHDGRVVIELDGHQYNVLGQKIK